jgi:hypothetical protein
MEESFLNVRTDVAMSCWVQENAGYVNIRI